MEKFVNVCLNEKKCLDLPSFFSLLGARKINVGEFAVGIRGIFFSPYFWGKRESEREREGERERERKARNTIAATSAEKCQSDHQIGQ
jgi:hypothetical protein